MVGDNGERNYAAVINCNKSLIVKHTITIWTQLIIEQYAAFLKDNSFSSVLEASSMTYNLDLFGQRYRDSHSSIK